MNFEKLQKWVPILLIGVPLLWLGLYLWSWMARVGCGTMPVGACWVSAFGNWGADVVMLQWVKNYQTLVGGGLAVVAGGFVVVAAAVQRTWERQLRTDQIRTDLLSKLAFLEYAFTSVVVNLRGPERVAGINLQVIEDVSLSLAGQAPAVTHFSVLCISEMRERLAAPEKGANLVEAARIAAIASDYFSCIDECVLPNGRFHWSVRKLTANTREFIETHGPLEKYNYMLSEFFEGFD